MLSPLVHWYVVITIAADGVRRQVHSSVIDHWLSLEKVLFSKIRLLSITESPLSRFRSLQLQLLREIGLLSLSSVRDSLTGDFSLALDKSNKVMELLCEKRLVDTKVSQSFREGQSRSFVIGKEGYQEIQCVDVLLNAAERIERKLEFMFGNLSLDGRWRVWANTCLISGANEIHNDKTRTKYEKLSRNEENDFSGFGVGLEIGMNPINQRGKSMYKEYSNGLGEAYRNRKNSQERDFHDIENLKAESIYSDENSEGNISVDLLEGEMFGFGNEKRKEIEKLVESKHEQRLDLLRHLSVMRQAAAQSAGSRALAYISMYQKLSSNIVVEFP
ncbi:hypothetical protein BB558_007344 [Smittium angustum]|nr:hypothetical protein BB558_007344 [Smittium angustum]